MAAGGMRLIAPPAAQLETGVTVGADENFCQME
jgi:hypothetical protein